MRRLRSDPAALAPAELEALLAARHDDPFAVLGMHVTDATVVVRCVQPGAQRVHVIRADTGRDLGPLRRLGGPVFAGSLACGDGAFDYRLRVWRDGEADDIVDPYALPPVLGELDCHLLAEGAHWRLYQRLGAHRRCHDGVDGVAFAVWAPNARRVSVVGEFNRWDARTHAMRRRPECGVWELFVPGLGEGGLYKYRVLGADGVDRDKADPCALRSEAPPGTASRVDAAGSMVWHDQAWMAGRARRQAADAPIAIYEVHAGSWRRDGGTVDFDRLADTLVPYVCRLGFTHVELMPVAEHPFGGSWGYQPTGLFAPSARWGAPNALRRFVDRCHQAGIGVLLDWVPAHFPDDPHGLARFDGTCLYEHDDVRRGRYPGWNTLAYNLGRREVANILIASALHWLREYHVDGLRVDAVASMLYLDYDRGPGAWTPNVHGGREHLEAIDFLRRFNHVVHEVAPAGAITIAEESTAWPGVTRPVHLGGLGFDCKWNMGWMNDTRRYMARDPVHRSHHHDELTFGLVYAHSERFVLPLSHDEVVHGKGSLLSRMPGDAWQQRANLRLYLAFQYTQPGHKLLFMGGEFGQWREWDHDGELDWPLLAQPEHAGIQRLVADLNRLYRGEPALHRCDRVPEGFAWIDCGDRAHSVLAWMRHDGGDGNTLLVVCNFTPVPRLGYRIGAPRPGVYLECLNSDAQAYGGSGCGNLGRVHAQQRPWHGLPCSLSLTLPPLAAVVLRAPS